MRIPLVNLTSSNSVYERIILRELKNIIKVGDYILGKEVEKFEKNFAGYIGTNYCISVASGTDALLLSLKALGIGEGDEVIIPAMTFIATASAVILAGAIPVLVDILQDSPLIDLSKIEQKITKKTKAIIPVHLHGYPCEMNGIKKLVKKHNLFILEDACQSHGSLYNNKHTGSLGDIAAFSFYPSKNLGAYGDAGAITTSNKKLADKVYLLRNYGTKEKYLHKIVGYNSRMDNLQAAVLNIKLRFLDKQNSNRIEHAKLYAKLLKDFPVELPEKMENIQTNYHIYSIRLKNRDKLLLYLKSKNIFCGIHYPYPLHLQPALSFLNFKKGDFPYSEKFAKETLSLPMYPELTNKQINFICKQIRLFLI